jgi:hypothetical protein
MRPGRSTVERAVMTSSSDESAGEFVGWLMGTGVTVRIWPETIESTFGSRQGCSLEMYRR